jgi:adenylate cyclase
MNLRPTLRQVFRLGWVLALAATLFATGLMEGLYRSGTADRLEHLYSDVWHRLAGQRHMPAHVGLVMIDDPSLNARPDEPLAFWTPHLARALAALKAAGAKAVAVDFIFSGSPERWIEKLGLMAKDASREYDRPFRQQINQGYVLLAGFRVGEGHSVDDFVLPSPDYLLALPGMDMVRSIGLANLRADPDSAVRRFALTEATGDFARKEGMPIIAFAPLAAVRASGQDPRGSAFRFGGRDLPAAAELRIAYAGPPGSFKAVSFEKLLRTDATSLPEVRALAGKVVILGAGYAGMNDVHPTPYSTSLGGENALMAGPEIQANIAETLLGGHFVEAAPASARLAVFLLLFGALAFVGVRLAPWRAVVLVLLAAMATALAAYWLFKADILFPVAHLHIGMVVVLGCLALMRLTREERERARIGAMFGRYVSDQVMTAILNSPELPELGGKAARITVLFSDIRNFTTISEKLAAREVVEMLNTYFERACAVLLAEGATIDKFIGDAIMAEFGAPLPQQDHAQRAVRAAVALRRVATEFRGWMAERFSGRDLPEFDVGIGLHSGEAVVGNIGSSARMEYTAIGDTVNIASRLEGMTKLTGCAILASRDTVAACGGDVRTGALHSLQVKGRHQPVDAYEVLHDES